MPTDKRLHFAAGAGIAFAAAFFVEPLVAVAGAALVGVTKVAFDHAAGRDVDLWGPVLTMAGGVLGVCVTAVLRGVL